MSVQAEGLGKYKHGDQKYSTIRSRVIRSMAGSEVQHNQKHGHQKHGLIRCTDHAIMMRVAASSGDILHLNTVIML